MPLFAGAERTCGESVAGERGGLGLGQALPARAVLPILQDTQSKRGGGVDKN